MRIICYGDSNTYGYEPGSYIGGRYKADSRWVDIISAKTGWHFENEGLNGRTIPCHGINISDDTDLLLVMLGTNYLLQGGTIQNITKKMEHFLLGLQIKKEKILLIAPPPMKVGLWVPSEELATDSTGLAASYCNLAKQLGIHFADSGRWNISMTFDGVHFSAEGHRAFAEGLYHFLCNNAELNEQIT